MIKGFTAWRYYPIFDMFKIGNERVVPNLRLSAHTSFPPDPIYQSKYTNCYLQCWTCLRCRAKTERDAHGDARLGKWRGKMRIEWVARKLCTVRRNMVYPALLPTIKTCDKLASSMVSRQSRSYIRQFQHHCFHITLNCCWHSEFSYFPYYDIWYDIFVNCNCDTR